MVTTPAIPIPLVVAAIQESKPDSILDIGCGFGRYGFLLREALDVLFRDKNSFVRKHWATKIDAVEVCAEYISELQRYIYNQILIGDIIEIIDKNILGSYDVILMADVIEHLTKDQGKQLLNWAYAQAKKMVIITTPSFFMNENEPGYDRHKALWKPDDFGAFPNKKILILENRVLCAFLMKENADFFLPMFHRSPTVQYLGKVGYKILKRFRWGAKIWRSLRNLKERRTYKKF